MKVRLVSPKFGGEKASKRSVVAQFDCHPEQAFFAQRTAWAIKVLTSSWAKRRIWASRASSLPWAQPKGRVLCDAIIARLARFLI